MSRPNRATSHDVARLAGVSQPTVSRALRGDPRVAETTRSRVAEAATALGYVPSLRGRSLSTQRTGQIAVVVGDLGNPFYMEAIEHLHAEVEKVGCRIVVLTDASEGGLTAEPLLDGSIDGAILTTTMLGSTLPGELHERGLPVVLMNRVTDDATLDACACANFDGAHAAGAELVALGHVALAAIFGPARTSTGRDREAGFRAALAAAGLDLPPDRVARGPFTFATGHDALIQLLQERRPPTAVFCSNDVIAIGALNAARGRGLAVPDDLSVIGFDDITMARWELLELTTIRQDLAAMAAASVAALMARIADPTRPPQQTTIETSLVRRGSHARV